MLVGGRKALAVDCSETIATTFIMLLLYASQLWNLKKKFWIIWNLQKKDQRHDYSHLPFTFSQHSSLPLLAGIYNTSLPIIHELNSVLLHKSLPTGSSCVWLQIWRYCLHIYVLHILGSFFLYVNFNSSWFYDYLQMRMKKIVSRLFEELWRNIGAQWRNIIKL